MARKYQVTVTRGKNVVDHETLFTSYVEAKSPKDAEKQVRDNEELDIPKDANVNVTLIKEEK